MSGKNIHFNEAARINKVPNAFHVMTKPFGPVCNLDCSYCYYLEKKGLYPDTADFKMAEELLERFTRDYIEEQKADTVNFTWQGGEPSIMGLDFFKKALAYQQKYAGRKKIENSFQTNGTLLNDDWCRFFANNKFLIGISVDGPEELHDRYRKNENGKTSFKQVMKSIELLHRYSVEFNTLTVVNDHNSIYPLKVYRFLKDIQSRFMQFIPIVERIAGNSKGLKLVTPDYQLEAEVTGWSVNPSDYGSFLVSIFDEWVRHDVGKYYVQMFDVTLGSWYGAPPGLCVFAETCGLAAVLEHNGDLYACDHFVYKDYLLGNILEKSLGDMFRSDEQFRFGMEKRDSLPVYCRRCEYLFACHGDCPKHRFIETPKGEKGLSYLCEAYKRFFRHVEPYMKFMVNELRNKRPPANIITHLRNKENMNNRSKEPGRNDPCVCGSGKKYKHCCG